MTTATTTNSSNNNYNGNDNDNNSHLLTFITRAKQTNIVEMVERQKTTFINKMLMIYYESQFAS